MPSKINLGEKSTPRVWITTFMSRRAFRIVSGSSALPDTLSKVCILDLYARGRTRQGTNAVAGAERGPCRFKSDAVAGTYDENLGHDSPKSYLFSAQ